MCKFLKCYMWNTPLIKSYYYIWILCCNIKTISRVESLFEMRHLIELEIGNERHVRQSYSLLLSNNRMRRFACFHKAVTRKFPLFFIETAPESLSSTCPDIDFAYLLFSFYFRQAYIFTSV